MKINNKAKRLSYYVACTTASIKKSDFIRYDKKAL